MLRLLHFGLVILILLAYAGPYIDPGVFWPIATLGIIAPALWLLLLLFSAYCWWRKHTLRWWSTTVLLLGIPMLQSVVAWPSFGQVAGEQLSVASLNVHVFQKEAWHKEPDQGKLIAYLASLDAEVLCFQEYVAGEEWSGTLNRILQSRLSYPYLHHDSRSRFAIFSRYPLRDCGSHFFENKVNGFAWCTLKRTAETSVQIFNVHLQSNTISSSAITQATEGDLQERETWLTIKNMFGRYGRASRERTQQVRLLLAKIQQSEYPVIAMGDFNDVPTSYPYHLLRKYLQDAHLERGFGLGATYNGALPGLRIDYILSDANFIIGEFRHQSAYFSDHKAIRADMYLQKTD